MKKILLAGGAIFLLLVVAVFFWARSVFAQDAVRNTLATQLSNALGQPVSIDGIGASVFPRVTVRLTGVRIGEPARAELETLHVGTALRALLSRRLEQASLLVEGARVELPLEFPGLASGAETEDGSAPVQLVSVDDIVLRDVQIVSGGRTLRGDVEIGARDAGLEIRRMSLTADDLALEGTGVITDLAGPAGEFTINADAINFNDFLAFVADFQGGSGLGGSATQSSGPTSSASANPSSSAMDIALTLDADRGRIGDLDLTALNGRARITPGIVMLEPIAFNVFDGSYKGALELTLDDVPEFHLTADLAGIDTAAATAFAGQPDALSGRMSGRIDLRGRGMDAASVAETTRGTVRVDVVDGIVKNLGLVRAIVIATAMRADTGTPVNRGAADEPFRNLGATLTVENGTARTGDLRFESDDLSVTAQGAIALDGDPITLTGRVQLSEQLTREGGTDLARYTQEQGRVTLPVTITGSAAGFSVRVDVGEMMQRAIRNRAEEEVKRTIERIFR